MVLTTTTNVDISIFSTTLPKKVHLKIEDNIYKMECDKFAEIAAAHLRNLVNPMNPPPPPPPHVLTFQTRPSSTFNLSVLLLKYCQGTQEVDIGSTY